MKKTRTITVAPDVARITEGLRDTGYDLNTAIADLIDNAIAANASFIDVRVGVKNDGEPVVAVGDNGHGMDETSLINCMRYGSHAEDEVTRLGKFGMGLKTASTAFCRRVIVLSRPNAKAKTLQAAWDLDHLATCGDWELELGKPDKDKLEYLDLCVQNGPGTAVIWEKIDRLLSAEVEPTEEGFTPTEHGSLDERLERLIKNLRTHLSMVFQRYLDPACDTTRTVRLRLNENTVHPWNPFCPAFATSAGTHILTVTRGEDVIPITVQAYLLPREETLPDNDARDNAKINARHQGIYVYRENRLIHGPDWLGIQGQDPVWTLLRVSLSFDARMDEAFMVDIKKSRVLINEHLYAWLKNAFLPPLLKSAEERWRQGTAKVTQQSAEMRHSVSDNVLTQHAANLRKADVLETFPERGEARVRNNNGTTLANVVLINGEDAPLRHIHTRAEAREDLLWEPSLIDGKAAVMLNVGHPFYNKVYMPNEQNSTLIQGLDFLFWALAQAEVNNVTDESRAFFAAMRTELARNVAKLTKALPE